MTGRSAAALSIPVIALAASCGPLPRSEPRITESMVRQVLAHPELKQRMHLEKKGRVPIRISDKLLEQFVDFPGFEHAVEVVPDAELSTGAFLRFNSLVESDAQVTVGVEYRVENVGGMFTFARDGSGEWVLREVRVWGD